ncbi:hypothetical protein [Chitinivorax sp. B]|nr:hypothetical protein [Chitinivorax sp. B]
MVTASSIQIIEAAINEDKPTPWQEQFGNLFNMVVNITNSDEHDMSARLD